ncbi:MAG: hypothetical protein KC445_11850 [Anaerolineales bacterium]|nr:hypothetical protein [Anaerolineales bacterium]
MEANQVGYTANNNPPQEMNALPNLEMLSHQIESLRVVLRRMRSNDSASLESLINQKLQALK